MRIGMSCVVAAAFAPALLWAGTIVQTDFRNAPGASWVLAGSTRVLEGTGAILVEKEELGAGTLALDTPLAADRLSIRAAFTLEPGAHGLGDGFAVGLVATANATILGDGAGLLGLGNLPACNAALIVEFDTFPNTPDDFGPSCAALVHVGAAYAPAGAVTGDAYLPTFAAADLRAFAGEGRPLAIEAEIHLHAGRVTVCAGTAGMPKTRVLEAALPGYTPFSGYLVFGAANGGLPGRACLTTVEVSDDALPPPPLQGRVASDGAAELAWQADDGVYAAFRLYRDGEELALLDPTARAYRDVAPLPGARVYELVASDDAGRDAPPAGVTLYTGAPALVVDRVSPGAEPSPHAGAWLYALEAMGRYAVRVGSVGDLALERFAFVMWIDGSGADQGTLPAEEQETLARYVRAGEGARLYLEGAELWSRSDAGPLAAVDGIRAAGEPWPCTTVFDSLGNARPYFGEHIGLDTLTAAPEELAGDATTLWRRATFASVLDVGAPIAIATRTELDRAVVLGSSLELCRLGEGHEDAVNACLELLSLPYAPPRFVRGDASNDGKVDIADAITVLNYLFGWKSNPSCFDAADANDDGAIQISDPIALLAYLFTNGTLPAPGGRVCGTDATPDGLPACGAAACK